MSDNNYIVPKIQNDLLPATLISSASNSTVELQLYPNKDANNNITDQIIKIKSDESLFYSDIAITDKTSPAYNVDLLNDYIKANILSTTLFEPEQPEIAFDYISDSTHSIVIDSTSSSPKKISQNSSAEVDHLQAFPVYDANTNLLGVVYRDYTGLSYSIDSGKNCIIIPNNNLLYPNQITSVIVQTFIDTDRTKETFKIFIGTLQEGIKSFTPGKDSQYIDELSGIESSVPTTSILPNIDKDIKFYFKQSIYNSSFIPSSVDGLVYSHIPGTFMPIYLVSIGNYPTDCGCPILVYVRNSWQDPTTGNTNSNFLYLTKYLRSNVKKYILNSLYNEFYSSPDTINPSYLDWNLIQTNGIFSTNPILSISGFGPNVSKLPDIVDILDYSLSYTSNEATSSAQYHVVVATPAFDSGSITIQLFTFSFINTLYKDTDLITPYQNRSALLKIDDDLGITFNIFAGNFSGLSVYYDSTDTTKFNLFITEKEKIWRYTNGSWTLDSNTGAIIPWIYNKSTDTKYSLYLDSSYIDRKFDPAQSNTSPALSGLRGFGIFKKTNTSFIGICASDLGHVLFDLISTKEDMLAPNITVTSDYRSFANLYNSYVNAFKVISNFNIAFSSGLYFSPILTYNKPSTGSCPIKEIELLPESLNTLNITAPIFKQLFYKDHTFGTDNYTQYINKYNQSLLSGNILPQDQDTSSSIFDEKIKVKYKVDFVGSTSLAATNPINYINPSDPFSFIKYIGAGTFSPLSILLYNYIVKTYKFYQIKTLLRASQTLSKNFSSSILEGEKEFTLPYENYFRGTVVSPPAIYSFTSSINPGDEGYTTTLSWKILGNITSGTISWTDTAGSHSIIVTDKIGSSDPITLYDTTTYTLNISGPGGSDSKNIIETVIAQTITVNPPTITLGPDTTQLFVASFAFGDPPVIWTTTAGSIDSTGLLTTPSSGTTITVRATIAAPDPNQGLFAESIVTLSIPVVLGGSFNSIVKTGSAKATGSSFGYPTVGSQYTDFNTSTYDSLHPIGIFQFDPNSNTDSFYLTNLQYPNYSSNNYYEITSDPNGSCPYVISYSGTDYSNITFNIKKLDLSKSYPSWVDVFSSSDFVSYVQSKGLDSPNDVSNAYLPIGIASLIFDGTLSHSTFVASNNDIVIKLCNQNIANLIPGYQFLNSFNTAIYDSSDTLWVSGTALGNPASSGALSNGGISKIDMRVPGALPNQFVGGQSGTHADGTGNSAVFKHIVASNFGSDGNLYVIDYDTAGSTAYISKIDVSTGVCSTVETFSTGGTGAAIGSQFCQNSTNTTFYVGINNKLYSVISNTATVLAGNTALNPNDGTGTAANFGSNSTMNCVLSQDGLNILICAHNLLRNYNISTSAVTTLAGDVTTATSAHTDGSGTAVQFVGCNAICLNLDSPGTYFIGDNDSIRLYDTSSGNVTTYLDYSTLLSYTSTYKGPFYSFGNNKLGLNYSSTYGLVGVSSSSGPNIFIKPFTGYVFIIYKQSDNSFNILYPPSIDPKLAYESGVEQIRYTYSPGWKGATVSDLTTFSVWAEPRAGEATGFVAIGNLGIVPGPEHTEAWNIVWTGETKIDTSKYLWISSNNSTDNSYFDYPVVAYSMTEFYCLFGDSTSNLYIGNCNPSTNTAYTIVGTGLLSGPVSGCLTLPDSADSTKWYLCVYDGITNIISSVDTTTNLFNSSPLPATFNGHTIAANQMSSNGLTSHSYSNASLSLEYDLSSNLYLNISTTQGFSYRMGVTGTSTLSSVLAASYTIDSLSPAISAIEIEKDSLFIKIPGSNSCYKYNVITDTITSLPDPPSPANLLQKYHVCQMLDGNIFFCGSSLGSLDAYIFNKTTLTWSILPNKTYPTSGNDLTCCAMLDNRVFVGDIHNEIYNPSTNSWTITADAPAGTGIFPSVCLLPDGKIFRGTGIDASSTANCAVYDPSLDSWTAMASLPVTQAKIVFSTYLNKLVAVPISGGGIYTATPATSWTSHIAGTGITDSRFSIKTTKYGIVVFCYGTTVNVFDGSYYTGDILNKNHYLGGIGDMEETIYIIGSDSADNGSVTIEYYSDGEIPPKPPKLSDP